MKAASVQQHTNTPNNQSRSLKSTSKSKFSRVLSISLAAAGLLIATPTFAQDAPAEANPSKQQLLCATEGQRLICDVQKPGQPSQPITFEQQAYAGNPTKTVALTPVKRTAIFTPELDEVLANALLWISYLSLPIGMSVAIWRYDQHARQQMVKLAQQMATLERIWQNPQAD
ncbi:MAG: hypothetical protein WA828_12035 [Coleofasciculaceae cyanobacterium]